MIAQRQGQRCLPLCVCLMLQVASAGPHLGICTRPPISVLAIAFHLHVFGGAAQPQAGRTQHPREIDFAGTSGHSRCGSTEGVGTAARFRHPGCLATSLRGLLVCDDHSKKVRLISIDPDTGAAGKTKTLFAGKGSLSAVAETAGGEILVADVRTQQIQKIVKGRVTVIAGHKVSQALPTADGKGPQATFKLPAALAADADLNIYVADSLDHKIRRVSRRTNTVTTLAGCGQEGFADGKGTSALFRQPSSVALWRGVLIVADTGNNAIRSVGLKTAAVTLLAGSHDGKGGFADGIASESRFEQPSAVSVHDNMLLVMEPHVHRIRSISLLAGTTMTLHVHQTEANARWAGLALFIQTPARGARLRRPGSRAGNVFMSDSNGCLVRALEIEAACDGRPFSHVLVDSCGVCGGNNSCVDCAGRPHGGRQVDKCGVCGGDGSSCPEAEYTRVQGGQMDKAGLPKPLIYMPSTYHAGQSSEQPHGGRGRGASHTIRAGGGANVSTSSWSFLPSPPLHNASDDKSTSTHASKTAKASGGAAEQMRAGDAGASNDAEKTSGGELLWHTSLVSTVAGDGTCARAVRHAGASRRALDTHLNLPEGLMYDRQGRLYIADTYNNAILALIPTGNGSSTPPRPAATTPYQQQASTDSSPEQFRSAPPVYSVRIVAGGRGGTRDGLGQAAEMDGPAGLALGAPEKLFICDSNNGLVRIAELTHAREPLRRGRAANGSAPRVGTGKLASKSTLAAPSGGGAWKMSTFDTSGSELSSPRGIAVDAQSGHVLVTDAQDNSLWEFEHFGRTRRLGPAGFALGAPRGMALDGAGRVVVADYNGRVLLLSKDRKRWTVLAKRGDRARLVKGKGDGLGSGPRQQARPLPALHSPVGVAVDGRNNIYVADAGAHAIFVLPGGLTGGAAEEEGLRSLTVLAGDGVPGVVDGVGLSARFVEPYALAVSPDGRSVMVADRRACLVRRLDLPRARRQPPSPRRPATVAAPASAQQLAAQDAGKSTEQERGGRIGEENKATPAPEDKMPSNTVPVSEKSLERAQQIGPEAQGPEQSARSSDHTTAAPSQKDLWVKRGLEQLFSKERPGNQTELDALKSEMQDAEAPQQRAQLAKIQDVLVAQRKRAEDRELAHLTHGRAQESSGADVLHDGRVGYGADVAQVDALKEAFAARLEQRPGAVSHQHGQDDYMPSQRPAIASRGAGSPPGSVPSASVTPHGRGDAGLDWETWRDEGLLDAAKRTIDGVHRGAGGQDSSALGSKASAYPSQGHLTQGYKGMASLAAQYQDTAPAAGQPGRQSIAGEGHVAKVQVPARSTKGGAMATTVMYDGAEEREVEVTTTEDLFANGTWESVMALLVGTGACLAAAHCWRHCPLSLHLRVVQPRVR